MLDVDVEKQTSHESYLFCVAEAIAEAKADLGGIAFALQREILKLPSDLRIMGYHSAVLQQQSLGIAEAE
tara:strand:+ start:68 stop:277 length:210 start_codon:yes stop_codon:yes gene_type:complete